MKYEESKEEHGDVDGNDMDISKNSKLHKALEALNDEDIQKLMEEGDEEESAFSEEHNQKMQQMIGEQLGPEAAKRMQAIQKLREADRNDKSSNKHDSGKSHHVYPRMKKVAAAVLAFVLLFTITMSTEAFRLPIVNFIMNVQKEFMAVNVEESGTSEQSVEAKTTIENVYILEKTIEGYDLVLEDIDDVYVLREYQNKEQDTYKFFQKGQTWNSFYDAEGTDYEMIETIYDNTMLSELNGMYYLVWNYDGYMFEISGSLTLEELIMLAESLTLEKNIKE